MTEVEPSMFSLQNPELWFAVASIIVIALAWKPIGKILAKTLDARADRIRADIAAAEKLLADAKTALARYTGTLANAEAEAERIIAQAQLEAADIRERAAEELEHALKAREQHVLDRIEQAEAAAMAEIKAATVTLAIQASRAAIREHLNDNQQAVLVQKAIGAVKSNLR
jgi:F-type H+-transporting ATPase subunit b